jgi:hypothetical protein
LKPGGKGGGGASGSSSGGSGKGGSGESGKGGDFFDTSTLNNNVPDMTGDSIGDILGDKATEEFQKAFMDELTGRETSPSNDVFEEGGRQNAQDLMDFMSGLAPSPNSPNLKEPGGRGGIFPDIPHNPQPSPCG